MKLKLHKTKLAAWLPMLALLFAFSSLQAQDDERKAKVSGGYGYFTPGIVSLDMVPLNAYLTPNGFSETSDLNFTLGGGGFIIVRNFILGGEGHSVISQELASPDQNVNLQGGWGQFNIGYVALSRRGFLLYPKLGIGGYNHQMTIRSAGATPSVDDVFSDGDYSGTELIRQGLLLSGAVGMQFMPGFDESAGSGLTFGLEVGYNYAATENAWTAYETALAGGPAMNMTGIFARLQIGFGGWHRQ
jgi:hypothetical protein